MCHHLQPNTIYPEKKKQQQNGTENYISSCDFWIFVSVFYALLIWLSFFLYFLVSKYTTCTQFSYVSCIEILDQYVKKGKRRWEKNTLNENIRFEKHNNNRLHYRTTYTHIKSRESEKHKVIDKIHKLHSFSVCLCLRFPSIWNNTIRLYVYHTLSIFNFLSLRNV